MNKTLWGVLLLAVLIFYSQLAHAQPDPRVVLVVIAHPDDETTMGGVLARLAEDGQVFLVVATDGRYGVSDHANIPAGDSLVSVRAQEVACSSERLGIEPPILLGLHDGLGRSMDSIGVGR